MRVRAMSSSGDMTFGQGTANFLIDVPAAVAQVCETRLLLWTGQWFVDLAEGTPYLSQILGKNTQSIYDNALIQRILGTESVIAIINYQSQLDRSSRALTYSVTLDTQYGQTGVNGNTPVPA